MSVLEGRMANVLIAYFSRAGENYFAGEIKKFENIKVKLNNVDNLINGISNFCSENNIKIRKRKMGISLCRRRSPA